MPRRRDVVPSYARNNIPPVLFSVSEAMYEEYDKLKKKYELETGTLEKAMERASQVRAGVDVFGDLAA